LITDSAISDSAAFESAMPSGRITIRPAGGSITLMSSFSGEDRKHHIHLVPKVTRIQRRKPPAARDVALIIGVLLVVFLGFKAAYFPPSGDFATSSRIDYVYVLSPDYVYRGANGVLLMDKRNGNIWFFANGSNTEMRFSDPVLVSRLRLEQLDGFRR
jgi:hypothetical protein